MGNPVENLPNEKASREACLMVVQAGLVPTALRTQLAETFRKWGWTIISISVQEKQPCAVQLYKLSELAEAPKEVVDLLASELKRDI